MRRDDQGAAGVIGAIVILAILSIALVYVNGVHVPRQGTAMETAAVDDATSAMLGLAGELAAAPRGPVAQEVPLRGERPLPPLLSGLVLTPARASGTLEALAASSNVTVSVVRDAPAGGVPAGDPARVDLGGGKMRLYLLGNATHGVPLGALRASVGGAYLEPATMQLEGGAVLSRGTGTSTALAPPSMLVTRTTTTNVAWRIPLLAGAASVGGGSLAQVTLTPGPEAEIGAASVYNATIRIDTSSISAWREALVASTGGAAFVNVTDLGAPDNGTVEATIVAPPGTPLTTSGVSMRLWVVRHEVALAERAS